MKWSREDFEHAADAFRWMRWTKANQQLRLVAAALMTDARSTSGRLTFQVAVIARNGGNPNDAHYPIALKMHIRFASCPARQELDSPSEPLLEIIENGGCYSIEHCYIDVRDQNNDPIRGFDVRSS